MSSRLVYVMGASGSGKDSLLAYVRTRLTAQDKAVVIHRYITRPADAGSENHIALTESEFEWRLTSGLFSMHWDSHGLRYAIGIELHTWLARGMTVLVNGSRQHLPMLIDRYPEIYPVTIQVEADILAQRLSQRGRESAEMIKARLHRADTALPRLLRVHTIDNSGPLEHAGDQLLDVVRSFSTVTA